MCATVTLGPHCYASVLLHADHFKTRRKKKEVLHIAIVYTITTVTIKRLFLQ